MQDAVTSSTMAGTPAAEARGRVTNGVVWAAYFVAISAAELATAYVSLELGMMAHLALLFALPVHAALAPAYQRPLLFGLMFAPLIRVVSLALPLEGLPTTWWYVLTSVPLFATAVVMIRMLGQSRREIGLRVGRLPVQLAIGLLGIPLGLAEYFTLWPDPLLPELTWGSFWLPALVLIVCTGLLEELMFRGILQSASAAVLGRWSLAYISGIFAVLHVGYLSPANLAIVFTIGFLFAWLVARTGSILGVTLAHGLTNIMLYLVLPIVLLPWVGPTEEPIDTPIEDVQPAVAVVPDVATQAGAVSDPGVGPTSTSAESAPVAATNPATPLPTTIAAPRGNVRVDPPMVRPIMRRADPLTPSPRAAEMPAPTAVAEATAAPQQDASAATAPDAANGDAASAPPAPDTSATDEATPVPTPEPERVQFVQYAIRRGDTLYRIAVAHGTTVDALVQANGIPNRDLILAGAIITVPNPENVPNPESAP